MNRILQLGIITQIAYTLYMLITSYFLMFGPVIAPDEYPFEIIFSFHTVLLIVHCFLISKFFSFKKIGILIPIFIAICGVKIWYEYELYIEITSVIINPKIELVNLVSYGLAIIYAIAIIFVTNNKLRTLYQYGIVLLIALIIQEVCFRFGVPYIGDILFFLLLAFECLVFVHLLSTELNKLKNLDDNILH